MTGREDLSARFLDRGWVRFGFDPAIAAWVRAVAPMAQRIAADPAERARWLRCGGTWFAGVNILPNDASGAVPGAGGVPGAGAVPLTGQCIDFARQLHGGADITWDRAQISVCYPGYPQPWDGESDAAFRFRRDRDAAHVDGLVRSGTDRRRTLGEAHAFVLGLPLAETPADAAPLVVWEGSHARMRRALAARLSGIAPEAWGGEDVTEAYTAARREIFETCRRVAVHAVPGEAYLVHRLALHGVAPWGADGGDAPRPIAYFRPDEGMTLGAWLEAP